MSAFRARRNDIGNPALCRAERSIVRRRGGWVVLRPRGSSLLPELCCLAPSSLNRPHPPHPRAQTPLFAGLSPAGKAASLAAPDPYVRLSRSGRSQRGLSIREWSPSAQQVRRRAGIIRQLNRRLAMRPARLTRETGLALRSNVLGEPRRLICKSTIPFPYLAISLCRGAQRFVRCFSDQSPAHSLQR